MPDFDSKALRLRKASEDASSWGRWLIIKKLLKEWVAEGVASDPHDFST